MEYDIVMITPFINSNNIYNLLDSIIRIKGVRICVILVDMLEKSIIINSDKYGQSNLFEIIHIKIGKRLNSSESRNIGLKYLFDNISSYRYVMFPDDDTTFDSSFSKLFLQINNGNFILNVLKNGTRERYARYSKADGSLMNKRDIRFIGCVRFLFTKQLVSLLGYFDERMGVGAKYGAGEDGDYFLRSLEITSLHYKELLYTFHPAPNEKYSVMSSIEIKNRFSNYSKGIMFLLIKHKMYRESALSIIRGFGGSFISLLKLNFRMSYVYFLASLSRFKYLIIFIFK